MQNFFEAYLDRLTALHDDAQRALEGLPEAALDWTPGPDMNSLTVLAIHLAGSEQFRIGDLIGRGATSRDRAAEFRTRNLTGESLKQRLAAVLADSRDALATLTLEDLDNTRVTPEGRVDTVAWLLAQTLAHTGLHVGHMQLMRQWWDQQATA